MRHIKYKFIISKFTDGTSRAISTLAKFQCTCSRTHPCFFAPLDRFQRWPVGCRTFLRSILMYGWSVLDRSLNGCNSHLQMRRWSEENGAVINSDLSEILSVVTDTGAWICLNTFRRKRQHFWPPSFTSRVKNLMSFFVVITDSVYRSRNVHSEFKFIYLVLSSVENKSVYCLSCLSVCTHTYKLK